MPQVQVPSQQTTDSFVDRGLSTSQVTAAFRQYGPNQIAARKRTATLTLVRRQFESTVIILLLAAALLSFCMHEAVQGCAILVAVIISSTVGFFTELKAQLSMESLERLAGPTARVLRNGVEQQIAASEVVPGDLVILDAGSRVPADLKLIECASLTIEESMLSGESVPVYKKNEPDATDEEANLAFQGTLVLSGRARGVVVATGIRTRLGQLGKLLSEAVATRTPLEIQLERLGRQLSWFTIVLCIILFVIGALSGIDAWKLFQTSIALAVAAIPEGMPVVATLALAVGTQKMVAQGALIRQLAAVETLGCTTVICTDKTGTLTENRMLVTALVLPSRRLEISGTGYAPIGELSENGAAICYTDDKLLLNLLRICVLCNDAKLERHIGENDWHIHGDPTEGALLTAAAKVGIDQGALADSFIRFAELPFDLDRKRMTTIHVTSEQKTLAAIKGSPITILGRCSRVATSDGSRDITDADRAWFSSQNDTLASEGLRVLGVATKSVDALPSESLIDDIENDLVMIGLVGMSDQPREGVREAIALCHNAGIKVIMITGDQKETAVKIAKDLRIINQIDQEKSALTGNQLETHTPEDLKNILQTASVLARVKPEMKLAIVKTLQGSGEIVAMTGDGVNDAPALKQANIGIAMGRSGTALAREAANIVITDDNFITITKAVEQGRIIYRNIQQSIGYLLTASLASVFSVFFAMLVVHDAPFSPLQLLWLNLIMHVFPGLALVLQPATKNMMNRAPRNPKESLLTFRMCLQIVGRAGYVTSFVIGSILFARHVQLASPHTVAFATLSTALLLQAISMSLANQPVKAWIQIVVSKSIIINMGLSALLLIASLNVAPVRQALGLSILDQSSLCLVGAASVLCFLLSHAAVAGLHKAHTHQKMTAPNS